MTPTSLDAGRSHHTTRIVETYLSDEAERRKIRIPARVSVFVQYNAASATEILVLRCGDFKRDYVVDGRIYGYTPQLDDFLDQLERELHPDRWAAPSV